MGESRVLHILYFFISLSSYNFDNIIKRKYQSSAAVNYIIIPLTVLVHRITFTLIRNNLVIAHKHNWISLSLLLEQIIPVLCKYICTYLYYVCNPLSFRAHRRVQPRGHYGAKAHYILCYYPTTLLFAGFNQFTTVTSACHQLTFY